MPVVSNAKFFSEITRLGLDLHFFDPTQHYNNGPQMFPCFPCKELSTADWCEHNSPQYEWSYCELVFLVIIQHFRSLVYVHGLWMILSWTGYMLGKVMALYFFPRIILYIFFLFLLIYGGLGFWGWGLRLGFWGWGFQLRGFWACGVGPSGFLGLRLSILT